VSVSY